MNYSKTKTKTKTKAKEEKPQEDSLASSPIILLNTSKEENPKLRMVGLFGDLVEEKVSDLVQGLMALKEYDIEEEREDPEDPESPVRALIYKPINFNISTWGGCARGMFAVYDTMRHVREYCDIVTYGLGKVMSAGVLLLAAGTKGQRKIGKNCRVMIHSCNAGNIGDYHNLKNEMAQIQDLQEKFVQCLVSETSLSSSQLNKLLDRKVNIYLTAEEAIEYGIADEIF